METKIKEAIEAIATNITKSDTQAMNYASAVLQLVTALQEIQERR